MIYLFVLRRDQPPTQEMMQLVLNGYREKFGNVQMLGGMKHDGPLPTEPDTYVVTICLAETKGLGFDNSRDEISYSTDMVSGEPVGVCKIEIKPAAQASHPAPLPAPQPAERPLAAASPAPMPVPLAPVEVPQAKLSAWERVMGVFTSPGATFADIARFPGWIIPILALTVLSLAVSGVMMQKVDWRSFLEKQMSKSSRWEQLSDDQKAQQLNIASKIIPYQTYTIGLLGPVLFVLVIGLVYWGAFNLFCGAGLKFKTAYSITAHACLVGLVSSPLLISIMLLKPAGEVDPEHLIASNIGEFLSNETPKWLLKLAGSLDIFTIWMLALLAIGFAAANPKKISKGGAYGVVFGIWAVVVLIKVVLAAIF